MTIMQEFQIQTLAELFSAFSDASRLKIIAILAEGECNVGRIAEAAELSESATSHHLRGLRQLKLVRSRKVGREVYYSLHDDHVIEIYETGRDHILHG
ncbi:MAG: winged helix-turn-helix transcriptional regulator [Anaerolineales bacterium]|nr:winged helix-turn-helix transcriptional regulator [Anaerolineales bacterium]